MKKCILLLSVCLVLLGTLPAADEISGETAGGGTVKDGYALLNDLSKIFEEITSKGSGLGSAVERLNAAIVDTSASFKAGKLDAVFNRRLNRLLLIYKLILIPMKGENAVWEQVIMKELNEFSLDCLGVDWDWKMKDPKAIGQMASALEEEFVNLWIYLDTLDKRQELKQKFAKSMLPPPPAQKK